MKTRLSSVLLFSLLLVSGCINPTPTPAPPPEPVPVIQTVELSAEACSKAYVSSLADVFESLEGRLIAGEFSNQAAFGAELDRLTKDARVNSFAPMAEAWQANNPDPWDPSADAANCRDTYTGMRKLLK